MIRSSFLKSLLAAYRLYLPVLLVASSTPLWSPHPNYVPLLTGFIAGNVGWYWHSWRKM